MAAVNAPETAQQEQLRGQDRPHAPEDPEEPVDVPAEDTDYDDVIQLSVN